MAATKNNDATKIIIAILAIFGLVKLFQYLSNKSNGKDLLSRFKKLLASGKVKSEEVEIVIEDPVTGAESVVSPMGESLEGDGGDNSTQRIADFINNSESKQFNIKVVDSRGQVVDADVIDLLGQGSTQKVYVQYCYDDLGNFSGTAALGATCPVGSSRKHYGWQ